MFVTPSGVLLKDHLNQWGDFLTKKIRFQILIRIFCHFFQIKARQALSDLKSC